MNDDLPESEKKTVSPGKQDLSREAIYPEKIQVSIDLDPEVLEQIQHLTSEPSKVIEAAIKQWLNGDRDRNTDLTRTFQRNPIIPPQGEWND